MAATPARRGMGRPRPLSSKIILSALWPILGLLATGPANAQDLGAFHAPAVYPQQAGSPSSSSLKLASAGLKRLEGRDFDQALQLFNAAIKFDGENANYHLLAATAYHLKFLARGAPEMRDDAEIGYKLAARYAPVNAGPWVQLGRLYQDSHDYPQAKDAFAKAVALQPDDLDALRGLATASYLVGDAITALWCADQMEARSAAPADVARMRAVLYGALGDHARSESYRAIFFADRGATEADRAALSDALHRNQRMIDGRAWSAAGDAPAGLSRASYVPVALASSSPAAAFADPTIPWWICGNGRDSPPPGSAGSIPTPVGADETLQLPPLPPSCPGAPLPHSALIDVVLVSTVDESDRSYGLNLLQGLTGYFGFSTNTSKALNGPKQKTTTTQFAVGGPGGPNAALSYALNIANSAVSHNEVIARPTLMAIDRVPSTFFSGESVSIAVGGGSGAISSLNDRHVGISVSITPTFLDNSHALLNVKVAQSSVESPWTQASGVDLQQSRNMASASMVATVGETVVLSGLTQREHGRTDSGVPILKNIPGLQYLFATSTPVDIYKSTMILLTVRGPHDQDPASAPPSAHEFSPITRRVQDYERQIAAETPDLQSKLAKLSADELYLGFRPTDLGVWDWQGSGLNAFVQTLRETLLH